MSASTPSTEALPPPPKERAEKPRQPEAVEGHKDYFRIIDNLPQSKPTPATANALQP